MGEGLSLDNFFSGGGGGMLIHNVNQEGLICSVAVTDIFKNASYVQWSLVDILNKICLLKIFMTSEIYLFFFYWIYCFL